MAKTLLDRFSPSEVVAAVEKLIRSGKLSVRDIEIAHLESRLLELRGTLARKPVAKAKAKVKAPVRLTPKQLAVRKRVGRYLGLLQKLNVSARAAVKKVGKAQGVEAGIAEAEKHLQP